MMAPLSRATRRNALRSAATAKTARGCDRHA
jgi:hypothetical protein